MKRRHRIKGALLYWAAVVAVLAVQAYAQQHQDQEAQIPLRATVDRKQA
ncbi:hypothetical protein KY487_01475 [Ralstonia pseudosolanacearum]|nr:hypothetical protein [Ralstonia pseudosolanacearum]MBX9427942.1 hypothetical protein [Ralstonia pseudosolanacearum]